jgi:hypothetical protein
MSYFGVTEDRIERANRQVGYVILTHSGEPTNVKNATTRAQATKNLRRALELGILSGTESDYRVQELTGLEYLRISGRYLGI